MSKHCLKEALINAIKSWDGKMYPYEYAIQLKNNLNMQWGEHYKDSNLERRLRPSEAAKYNIVTVYNDTSCRSVKGWYWNKNKVELIEGNNGQQELLPVGLSPSLV